MPAILFGSISTLADTSELQREAFNAAFDEHGLGWRWDRDDYRAMLAGNGGEQRIADHAASLGQDVDAGAVHATKSRIFQERLADAGLHARDGVAATVRDARSNGVKVGLVTTTSRANIDALLAALSGEVAADDFDVIVDADAVERPKPDPEAYTHALAALDEDGAACVAIEDNVGGVAAATGAGVACAAYPNANTADHDFTAAAERVDGLRFEHLRALATI